MYLVEFSKKSVYFFDVLIQRKIIMIVHNLVKKIQNDITFIEEDRELKITHESPFRFFKCFFQL